MPGRADFDGRVWSPCLTAALFSSLDGFLASTRAQSSALVGGSQAIPGRPGLESVQFEDGISCDSYLIRPFDQEEIEDR